MNLVFSTKARTKNPSVVMDTILDPLPIIKQPYIFDQFKKDPLPRNLLVPSNKYNLQQGMLARLIPDGSQGCGGCGKNVK